MTFLRYLFFGVIGLVLVVLALANRAPVTLRLIPEDMGLSPELSTGVSLPLFVVIFLAIGLGLLVGFTWEWLREHKHRAEARSQRAQKEKLEKQLAKSEAAAPQDDVLALLDQPR